MLVDGKWSETWKPVQATDAKGGFVRQVSSFRSWVTPDGAAGPTGDGGFRAEPGRYHLYASFGCPWATRVLIARKLKRLEDVVSVAIVEPMMTEQGWRFGDYPGADRDGVNGATYLPDLYKRRSAFHRPGHRPGFMGQAAPHDRQQRIRRPPPHI
jgi:putative glutathione S-transferase